MICPMLVQCLKPKESFLSWLKQTFKNTLELLLEMGHSWT